MRTYTAHLKAARAPVLVREGWSWAGFLFGPLWLFAKRAWIPAVIETAAIVCLFALAPEPFRAPVLFGLALLVGVLGRDLVRWSLGRRGYALTHVLAARDEDAALGRLLAGRADLLEQMR